MTKTKPKVNDDLTALKDCMTLPQLAHYNILIAGEVVLDPVWNALMAFHLNNIQVDFFRSKNSNPGKPPALSYNLHDKGYPYKTVANGLLHAENIARIAERRSIYKDRDEKDFYLSPAELCEFAAIALQATTDVEA